MKTSDMTFEKAFDLLQCRIHGAIEDATQILVDSGLDHLTDHDVLKDFRKAEADRIHAILVVTPLEDWSQLIYEYSPICRPADIAPSLRNQSDDLGFPYDS